MGYPQTIQSLGLPQRDGTRHNPTQAYTFWLGYPEHMPGNKKLILRIPERPHRGAEGRPKFPEQAEWIDQIIRERGMRLTAVWHAHWRIENEAALTKLLALLRG